ncbi:MAG: tetratricopeptide repeat protein [Oscillochloridaceae bacterium umkhey_bin13]
MEPMPLLLVLLVGALAILVISLGFTGWRRRTALSRPTPVPPDPDVIEMQAEEREGGAVAALPEPPQLWYQRGYQQGNWRAPLLLVALVLLIGTVFVAFGNWSARTPDRFVVLVAPFADGADGQAGRNVATELVRLLDSANRGDLTALVAPSRPQTASEALALLETEQADLVIWGQIEPGALLDSAALLPRLVYRPDGPYAPHAWEGYLGRFAMPVHYELARAPINGQAVLAPLIVALYDYANGRPDPAFSQLESLLASYPALQAPLPRALRGNVLWGRGLYAEAALEYRLALAEPSSDPALLANNLGAILLDADDPAALAALAETVRLLDGRDLGALRMNLGYLALREQRFADAAVELEQARNLLPPSTPLLLDLATAYRETGRLNLAATTLAEADRQSRQDPARVAQVYRAIFNRRIEAALAEARALLDLARLLETQGPLRWELELAQPQPVEALRPIRDQLERAATAADQVVGMWRRLAASESAAYPGAGALASGQAERAERQLAQTRYHLALVSGEIERVTTTRPNGNFAALFGTGTNRSAALNLLEDLARRNPGSAPIQLAIGRTQRLLGQPDAADTSYDRAVALAPQQPEGYFGKGQVALQRGDPARASELFTVALDRNGSFFPANVLLARLAADQGDWATALRHRRAVAASNPGPASQLALAQTLRLSGIEGWAEAEQVLIPLAVSRADAAIELGRLYNDAGQPEVALSAYRDALRLDRRNSAAAFELGETLVAQGEYLAAEQALRDALRFDERNLDARLALADLYQGPLANPGRADAEYRTALAQGVRDAERLERIGDAAKANGTNEQAINAFRQALELRPDDPTLHYKLGQSYAAAGRLELAEQQLQQALERTGDPTLRAAILVARGEVARRQQKFSEALGFYEQADQLNPNLVESQLGPGLIAVDQGNWGVAHSYFQRAVARPAGTTDADAQFWFAESLLRQGELRAAAERYTLALELRPRFPEAYLGLAQVEHAQGAYDDALTTVNRALGQRPTFAEALLFKGKLHQEQGRTGQAMSAYDQSIAANARIPETHYRRGVLRIQTGQYDGAITDLRRAGQLQPNFPDAAYWLGRAYYAQGRLPAALEAFQQAISYNATYLEAIFYSGLVAEDLGRTADAISAYQTVIQLDAASDFAARARAQLARLI